MFSNNDTVYSIPGRILLEQAQGRFAKRVFVIARHPAGHTNEPAFLNKVLTAAGLHLEQDALFATVEHGQAVAVLPVLKEKQPEHVLVFGLQPFEIGINIQCPLYQPVEFYGATFLFADTLAALEPDKTLKTRLWQALQQLFL